MTCAKNLQKRKIYQYGYSIVTYNNCILLKIKSTLDYKLDLIFKPVYFLKPVHSINSIHFLHSYV